MNLYKDCKIYSEKLKTKKILESAIKPNIFLGLYKICNSLIGVAYFDQRQRLIA